MDQKPETLDTQVEMIQGFLKRELKPGDKVYLLDTGWFRKWKTYVGYDQRDQSKKGHSHPGPIDNSPLLKDDPGALKDHLREAFHYIFLPEDGWVFMVQNYGTLHDRKDIIQRRVIDEKGIFETHYKVEVYLMSLLLGNFTNWMIRKEMSRYDTIESLVYYMREQFSISDEVEVRLWRKSTGSKKTSRALDNKREETLQEAGLYSDDRIYIETRNKDGTWPRGGTEEGFKVSKERRQNLKKDKGSEKQRDIQSEEAVEGAQELVQCHHDDCESSALLYCTTCQENLCPGCAGLHMLKKSKRGHNVVEYQTKDACRVHVYCATHDPMICELYCEQCEIPVCPNCLIDKSHKGHDYKKIVDGIKSCIQKEKYGIENHIQRLHEKTEALDTKMKEREEKYSNLLKEVEIREKELLEAVKTVAAQRRQTIDDIKASDKSQIQAEGNKLNLQITEAEKELESCEKLLQNQNPDQMLSFESRISEFQVVPEINLDLKTRCFTRGSLSTDDVAAGFGDIQ
uniref:Ubiquitin carboxyl-terminal hydrolase 4-like isoform X2 n=1 Tax=Crassostrea virginica TaxID=6565 RepID=A0A8B8AYR7_CRAVI|nr:ubiquitin carboxyl-terminal hydrolase 4-like isoform X2 [Crassostrea virginica]